MKLFIVTLFFLGAVALSSAQIFGRGEPPRGRGGSPPQGPPPQNSEQARKAQEMIQRCQSQEKATETDMNEFSQQRRPSAKTGKCLHACLMESIGLIENGQFSAQNSVRFMSGMARGNTELIKIVEEISKECERESDADRCELAFKIMTCTEEGIRKRQDEMRKHMPRAPQ